MAFQQFFAPVFFQQQQQMQHFPAVFMHSQQQQIYHLQQQMLPMMQQPFYQQQQFQPNLVWVFPNGHVNLGVAAAKKPLGQQNNLKSTRSVNNNNSTQRGNIQQQQQPKKLPSPSVNTPPPPPPPPFSPISNPFIQEENNNNNNSSGEADVEADHLCTRFDGGCHSVLHDEVMKILDDRVHEKFINNEEFAGLNLFDPIDYSKIPASFYDEALIGDYLGIAEDMSEDDPYEEEEYAFVSGGDLNSTFDQGDEQQQCYDSALHDSDKFNSFFNNNNNNNNPSIASPNQALADFYNNLHHIHPPTFFSCGESVFDKTIPSCQSSVVF